MRIEGCTKAGKFLTYDVFIREDPSLNRSLPTWLTVLDWTVVDVSYMKPCELAYVIVSLLLL